VDLAINSSLSISVLLQDGNSALMQACNDGYLDGAKLLLHKGAKANLQNKVFYYDIAIVAIEGEMRNRGRYKIS
jgi:ankyrin repeat protein